jgi:glycerol uptake facilitator-like aquaporin
MLRVTRARRMTAEAVGTALLLAAVVGSGIMGERLAGGNVERPTTGCGPPWSGVRLLFR